MHAVTRPLALISIIVSFLACGGGLDGDTVDEARRSAAAWSTFRQEADALLQRIQTTADPAARERLLGQCRTQRAELLRNESRFAPVVKMLCDDIKVEELDSGETMWGQIAIRAERIERGMREDLEARTSSAG